MEQFSHLKHGLIVGLTGGIASGKSTLSAYFVRLGLPVLDADEIARELVQPGTPLAEELRQAFGPRYFHADGSVNRAQLRRLALEDEAARKSLEGLVHPQVYRTLWARAESLDVPCCILSVPLLVETAQTGCVHRVLVIDCPPALQRRRLAQRPGLAPADIDKLLAIQCDRETRLRYAHEAVYNTGNLAALEKQAVACQRFYRALAQSRLPVVAE